MKGGIISTPTYAIVTPKEKQTEKWFAMNRCNFTDSGFLFLFMYLAISVEGNLNYFTSSLPSSSTNPSKSLAELPPSSAAAKALSLSSLAFIF